MTNTKDSRPRRRSTVMTTKFTPANSAILTAADPTILTAADPGWDQARRAWNLAVDQQPTAIARPGRRHPAAGG